MGEKSTAGCEDTFWRAWDFCNGRLKLELIRYSKGRLVEKEKIEKGISRAIKDWRDLIKYSKNHHVKKGSIENRLSKALEKLAEKYFHYRAGSYYTVDSLIDRADVLLEDRKYCESIFYYRQALLGIADANGREVDCESSISPADERVKKIYENASWLRSMPKRIEYSLDPPERPADDSALGERTKREKEILASARRIREEFEELGISMHPEEKKEKKRYICKKSPEESNGTKA